MNDSVILTLIPSNIFATLPHPYTQLKQDGTSSKGIEAERVDFLPHLFITMFIFILFFIIFS